MKKRAFAILLAGVLAFTLSACSQTEDGGSEPESSAAASTMTTTVTTTETTTTTTATTTTTVPETTTTTTTTTTQAQDDTWFSDAAFVGDSRTEGLILYTGLETEVFAEKGLNVRTALSSALFTLDGGGKGTAIDALRQKKPAKVYIMLGVNELGWAYSSVFQEEYGTLVDAVRDAVPDAVIYVQSILPVTKAHSDAHSYQNKARVDEFNGLIREMCTQKGVNYLKVEDAVMTSDGYLNPELAAEDGVHLNAAGCRAWLQYLREHHG